LVIIGYEARVVASDVFLLDCSADSPNGEQNQEKCKKEALWLRRQISTASGTARWSTHKHITRLVRLCEHKDIGVTRAALAELAKLAQADQMSGTLPLPDSQGNAIKQFHETNSFFLCLTPTEPTTMTLIHNITSSPDQDVRHYATQVLTVFLQMNIGNKVAAPVTFHETLIKFDQHIMHEGYSTLLLPHNLPARTEGQITRDIVQYSVDKYNDPTNNKDHNLCAAQLVMEICNADSNKLVVASEVMLPMLAEWMAIGDMFQQYVAVHLVAMISNRFDLAKKVIASKCVVEIIKLFKATNSVYGLFDSKLEATKVPSIQSGQSLPSTFEVNAKILPKKYKRMSKFIQASLSTSLLDSDKSGSSSPDDIGVPTIVTFDVECQLILQGDILHDCIQAIVELAGASRAPGRRQLLEAGAIDIINECLHFELASGVDTQDIMLKIQDDLLHEALRASHAFLSSRFGMEDIEFDDDFHKPWVFLSAWKEKVIAEEDWDAEVEIGSSLTAVQRRKAHIMCAFQQLDHNSVGTIGKRKVIASLSDKLKPEKFRKTSEVSAKADKEAPVIDDNTDKPQWLIEWEQSPQTNDDEDKIYQWCWETTASLGVGHQVLQMARPDADDPTLRFHAVDILTKLVEHNLAKAEDESAILNIMQHALLASDSHGMALMGATALDVIVSRNKLYRPYGFRSKQTDSALPVLRGIELFRWGVTMVKWTMTWYNESDGEPDFSVGEGGFAF